MGDASPSGGRGPSSGSGVLLSAAMIVRNEAAVLGDCLRSLAGVCDEVVVVDTGSTDATREIADQHGARLYEQPWTGDFSRARNFALEQVRGAWVLYVDADERVRPVDRDYLTTTLARPDLVALQVRFHPRTGFTAYREHRLFRADPRIRFEGAIHETMMPSIHWVATADGMRIAPCELTIDHVGYDGDQSHKYPRNLSLLRKQIAVDPERIYLHWHLGTVLRAMGDLAEARASFEEGIRLSEQTDVTTSAVEGCLCYVDLAKLLAEQGEDILPLLRRAISRFPDNHLLRWMEATTRLDRGDVAGAQPVLEALADIDPDTVVDGMSYDQRIFGAPNYAALGTAAFRAGAFSESAAWYRRAEAKDGESAEYRTKRLLAEVCTARTAARSKDLATASCSHPRS